MASLYTTRESVEFHGESNHVHLPVNFPQQVPYRSTVNYEGCLARRMRQEFPEPVSSAFGTGLALTGREISRREDRPVTSCRKSPATNGSEEVAGSEFGSAGSNTGPGRASGLFVVSFSRPIPAS